MEYGPSGGTSKFQVEELVEGELAKFRRLTFELGRQKYLSCTLTIAVYTVNTHKVGKLLGG